jgi:DNA-binding transcriptional LysR family regulator
MSDLPRPQALRCFITVAREGTVSRAAASLHLTQPAVSLQLKGWKKAPGCSFSTGRRADLP